jgi:hypothetical protein
MKQFSTLILTVAILFASAHAPLLAQDRAPAGPVYRHDVWYFDGRDDDRDFPTNGFFPGDFAANPVDALFGVAGIFGSNPAHAPYRYPSQAAVEPSREQIDCARRYRSYDPVSGTFLGADHLRHRC